MLPPRPGHFCGVLGQSNCELSCIGGLLPLSRCYRTTDWGFLPGGQLPSGSSSVPSSARGGPHTALQAGAPSPWAPRSVPRRADGYCSELVWDLGGVRGWFPGPSVYAHSEAGLVCLSCQGGVSSGLLSPSHRRPNLVHTSTTVSHSGECVLPSLSQRQTSRPRVGQGEILFVSLPQRQWVFSCLGWGYGFPVPSTMV